MTLRTKFLLFAVLVHALLAVMGYFLLQQNKYLFIGMEVVILVSVVVTVQLYQAFFKPLNLIRSGIESIRDKDFSTKFVSVGQQELDELVEVYNRMIDQLRQERVAQAEKHYLLEKLIQASPAGIVMLGFDNVAESVNPAAERYLGVGAKELKGRHLNNFPEAWAGELALLNDGESRTFRLNGIRTYRCHRAHFIDRGFQHSFILMEELTEAIVKNERQAYEKVIRMMSHEVNNSSGAINSILDSLHYYAPQLQPHDREDFEGVLRVAITRNTNLSKFMANFADVVRLPLPKKKPVDLHQLLQRLERFMHLDMQRRNITCSMQLAEAPLVLELDEQQIEQVLINILKNAAEAIGQDGHITVHTQHTPALLTISDTGPGIPAHVLPQLFTPFFSTKETGQGIGLTMVREILMNHGCNFSLQSNGCGLTEFSIHFQ